jgi:hypothetical protein
MTVVDSSRIVVANWQRLVLWLLFLFLIVTIQALVVGLKSS